MVRHGVEQGSALTATRAGESTRSRIADEVAATGYVGPLPVLSRDDCRRFLAQVDLQPRAPLDWGKGHAVTSRAYYEVATAPAVVDVVAELLGGSVVLWGASIQSRGPGAVHAWHSDVESAAPDSRTVSVWIGLEGTTPDSSLFVAPRSHTLGRTVQELRYERRKRREDVGTDDVAAWLRELDGDGGVVTVPARDGEAVFFDGRLWHATNNTTARRRRALLLQYAAADMAIRIPESSVSEWPFRLLDRPRPPCLIVRGSAPSGVNRIVRAPLRPTPAGVELTSRIHPLRLPLAAGSDEAWTRQPLFRGATADVAFLSCHASALASDVTPHPPHAHDEEELLVLLAGEVELTLGEGERVPFRAGELLYHPAGFVHTLRTTSQDAATYVIFKWRGEAAGDEVSLSHGRFRFDGDPGVLFEGPTRYLRELHSHVTVLEPGGGYEPHVDAYDVAIVVVEGELETIGTCALPNDVVFYPAGEPHGMRNVGETPARYVVFEFHGRSTLASGAPRPAAVLLARLRDRRRWRHLLQRLRRRS